VQNPAPSQYREIVAALMCSRLYFDLALVERLALIKSLCAYHGNAHGQLSPPAGR
jgi:hypothetical protein